ncbi:hypothetical protein J0S82_009933 [Galemys pyrenaicus]|uniref:Guanylate-binding protein/Atlastin C-terminal domain-containing protein n=1 Tax=Galemys pyrenaicus TaxID=202257 RepID=A0A8J6AIB4_GALPY|nr:hypothetical protein J0S82_009933 [Galemys pyrenaicus]
MEKMVSAISATKYVASSLLRPSIKSAAEATAARKAGGTLFIHIIHIYTPRALGLLHQPHCEYLQNLLLTYVNAINSGHLPCTENSVSALAQIKNSEALQN